MAFSLLLSLFAGNIASAEMDLAKQTLAEINLARGNPRTYAGFLREFRGRFQGNSYRMPGSDLLVMTREGVRAVDEAIRFLTRQPALPPLAWSTGLAAAAAELVKEEGMSGAVGHVGRLCGDPRQRIERHVDWQGKIGENICYGPEEARLVVMDLLIDDAVADRGHRKNIFTRAFGVAGVACGPHPSFVNTCVIDFAGRLQTSDIRR
ncbi:MAG TPA: CAP domain-containing protein [Geobacteraceae bacterium]|nr:CAP domain-containing protein [Geobacteraceae bacterium]